MLTQYGLLYKIIYENINQVFLVSHFVCIYSFNNKSFLIIMRTIIEIY